MKMCYHPWVGLDISPQGEFKPCCKYSNSIAKSLDDYQTSDELAQLRYDFTNGIQPAGCQRCWRDEDANLPSKRILDNEYIFHNYAPALDSIKVLSIPFGNTCNLACRICNSYSSSKWGSESKKLQGKFPEIKIWGHNKFYKDDTFMHGVLSATNDVIHVDIPGGEPFYADSVTHSNFLKHLISHNASNISIHYVTNATRFPDTQFLELWSHFKNVDIQLSLDGTETKFEYNRWPAKWDNVAHNVVKWQKHRQQESNIQLSVSHSVSIFTVLYLPEFLKWCLDSGLPSPYLGLVTNPSYYNITILPSDVKLAIEGKFKSHPELNSIIAAMWAKDDSKELDLFVNYVKILDKQRNQSFLKTFPELYQLLGKKCQTLSQLY